MPSIERAIRILFVFASLAGGAEEAELCRLARALDPARFEMGAVACFSDERTPDQAHALLEAAGVAVDRTPYHLSYDDTVAYLAGKLPAYDLVVACQNVADVYPALERLHLRPPLIEYGMRVAEALAGPKHLTARYVGASTSVRDAAASRMAGRAHQAVVIPASLDDGSFDPEERASIRAGLAVQDHEPLIGWVGRLSSSNSAEDFINAAAMVHAARPDARFVIIGESDPALPNQMIALRARCMSLGLEKVLALLVDRKDVPALLVALDIVAWLSRGEGDPRIIAQAGVAALPVIATYDEGSAEQMVDGVSGLFVPDANPSVAAEAITYLIDHPIVSATLGTALRAKVGAERTMAALAPRWEKLFAAVLAERAPPARPTGLFKSFLHGGFESSTHRRALDRQRIDMIAASHHDVHAEHDYRQLAQHGIQTVRDGLRWHLIERLPGRYDWSSVEAQLAAAQATGTEVIWDLLHYGWPDHLDIWTPAFVTRFAAFAAAVAQYIGPAAPRERRFYAPVNEISFFSWGGGDVAYLNPFARGRGHELKVQLARAAIAAMEAILLVDPAARFVHADPVINIVARADRPEDTPLAEGHRLAQFQAWDMIVGRVWPQIGGRPGLLDVIGVNYYHNNQWFHGGGSLLPDDPAAKPFRQILAETYARYGRPIFVAETGIEGDARAAWLRMIVAEVEAAIAMGVPVEGICLYPILDHPGWDDGRYCPNGLLSFDVVANRRRADPSLSAEIAALRGL